MSRSFGFKTFGTVYGLANTLSGLFGLVQYPIDLLVKQGLDGDYTPVNIGLLLAGALSSAAITARIWFGTRKPRPAAISA